ncbi:MAG: ATP-binding protein [Anaerolineae bacterium]|nr:ATP-binding protein [Anaerolineae bacterium]
MERGTESLTTLHLFRLSAILSQAAELKSVLDELSDYLRNILIFDNFIIYILDSKQNLNAYYSRALGRGRGMSDELDWGEKIAAQIIGQNRMILKTPTPGRNTNRLDNPYFLGIPLAYQGRCHGAFLLIRFGSPAFNTDECELAAFVSQQLGFLINRQMLDEEFMQLSGEKQQIKLREDFFTNLTHELRTPLGCIKGYTTTLLRSDTSWDAGTQLEFLQIIETETDYLQQLIDNLLDSSRMSSGLLKMSFHPTHLEVVIKESVEHLLLRFPGYDIKLDIPDHLEAIEGDSRRLRQVFDNILNNATKYAPESQIWVRIKQNQHQTTISIRDFGPGINEKYLPYVFDRFFRSPDLLPNIHGSGLGLFICQQIIQAHHGVITAASKIGEGTTFTVLLPDSQREEDLVLVKHQEELA